MEASKDAISRHTSRRGHFTNVEEMVRPAITSETVKPHRHEITTEAMDREVHRHHYHTTVQPLSHREVLPEKHTHNLLPMRKTEHIHEDPEHTKSRVAAFAAQFKDHSITHPTTHSKEHKPQVIGEHVHHHVHETVQPVIYKETHHRETVHTTVPIHEVHHQKAMHHGMSSMPIKTMEEFLSYHKDRKPGEMRHSSHEGAPREYDSKLATTFEKLGLHLPHHDREEEGVKDSRRPAPIDTSRTAAPLTPSRSPLREGHRSGSDSTRSSLSDDMPATPTSPRFGNNNKMDRDGTITSPTHNIDTYTPNTHVNTQTTTKTSVNRIPSKNVNSNGPVRIANADGETSPRVSSDEASPRRSFMDRVRSVVH